MSMYWLISFRGAAHRRRRAVGAWLCAAGLIGLASCGAQGLMNPPDGNGGGIRPECPTGQALAETTVSYAADIVPVIQAHGCLTIGCHGGGLPTFNYSLETYKGIFGPGDTAVALGTCNVVPGDPDSSFLIEKISSDSPRAGVRMPQNRPPLSDEEIALIRTWITEGAADN